MKAKVLEDGRLVCPNCPGNVDLGYHQEFRRNDSYVVRFDADKDQLYMIGNPWSETTEIYDEYLLCSSCHSRFDVPWGENSHEEQEEIAYEGDYLRDVKDLMPLHECPKCGATDQIHHSEEYDVIQRVRNSEGMTVFVAFEHVINYEQGGRNEHFHCYACQCKWSVPKGTKFDLG